MNKFNSHHQYNYSPAKEAANKKKATIKEVFIFLATLVVFAGIGVLLAWQG